MLFVLGVLNTLINAYICGIGRTDHRCDNAYQYADPGTDRKYPESYLYASGSDQPTGEAGESYTNG